MGFCISCGSQLQPDSQFCISCGKPAGEHTPQSQQAQTTAPQPKGNNLMLLWILLPILLVVIGGGVVALVLLVKPGGTGNGTFSAGPVEPGDTPEKTVASLKTALFNEDFDGMFKLIHEKARKQLEEGKDQMIQGIQFFRNQDPATLSDEQKALVSLSDDQLRRMTFPQILKHMVSKSPKLKKEYEKVKKLNVTKVEPVGDTMAKVTYTEDGESKDMYLVKEANKWYLEKLPD